MWQLKISGLVVSVSIRRLIMREEYRGPPEIITRGEGGTIRAYCVSSMNEEDHNSLGLRTGLRPQKAKRRLGDWYCGNLAIAFLISGLAARINSEDPGL
jgi:hypothetical protein